VQTPLRTHRHSRQPLLCSIYYRGHRIFQQLEHLYIKDFYMCGNAWLYTRKLQFIRKIIFPRDLSAGPLLDSDCKKSYQYPPKSLSFFTNYSCLMPSARKNVVSESVVAVDDCDPAFNQVFVNDWVTVVDSTFIVWAICDHRLWQPRFTPPNPNSFDDKVQ